MTEPFPPTEGPDQAASNAPPGGAWAPPAATAAPTGQLPGRPQPTVPFGPVPEVPVDEVTVSGDHRRGRSTGKLVGAAVGVTALIAAGAFAVVSITGDDDSGGAASPAEVGTKLTSALDDEDVLGVVDLLLPGERQTFRDPLIRTVDNLKRLEVLADDASLEGVEGLDVQFADVSVREERTNVDDIVNIYLSGSATVSVDGDRLPIGDLLLEEAFDGDRPEEPTEPQSGEFEDVRMTVVERGGRWYLSAFYSAAEAARGDADVPAEGVEPAGASEPEMAVEQMLQAFADQELEELIAVLDPTEGEALQRYAPLFLDQAQDGIDGLDLDVSIDDTEFAVEGEGDRRTVTVTSATVVISDASGEASDEIVVAYADDCLTVTVDGEETQTCGLGDGGLGDLADDVDLGDDGAVSELLDTLDEAFDDYDPSGLGVHRVNGEWYVSPLSTVFDALNDVLDALDRDELTDVIDAFAELGDIGDVGDVGDLPGLFEQGAGPDTGFGTGDAGSGDAADASPAETVPAETVPAETVPAETVPAETVPDTAAADDAISLCYEEVDPAAGVACMQAGIAAGTIDPDYVTAPIRFPQCGAAEPYWSAVYTMDDASFVALVEQTAPCLLDLVRSGELDKYLLPSEFVDPSCLEGRNWYTTYEDEYNDRFFECVSAAREAL